VTTWDQFATDLSRAYGEGALNDFRQSLYDNEAFQEKMIRARQRRIKAASDRIGNAWVDGLGEQIMSIDADVYWHWQRKEPGCWNDKTFRKEFMRDNPEVAIKNRSRKTMIVRP
jgi:hypothetical protein